MKLFVGLGNPGAKYARNRHNVGFMAVDAIADRHGFGPWRAKFSGQIAEGRLGSEKILLLKPETYMNRSGDAVQPATAFYKLAPEDVFAFHDELDLAPGRLRVKTGGGHAGHNGLRSIAAHLGPGFTRIRIGIGHPGQNLVSGYVLNDFARAEEDWLSPLLDAIATCAPDLLAEDRNRFQSEIARQLTPPREREGGARPASAARAEPAAQQLPRRRPRRIRRACFAN